jgi:hypothetical protein
MREEGGEGMESSLSCWAGLLTHFSRRNRQALCQSSHLSLLHLKEREEKGQGQRQV